MCTIDLPNDELDHIWKESNSKVVEIGNDTDLYHGGNIQELHDFVVHRPAWFSLNKETSEQYANWKGCSKLPRFLLHVRPLHALRLADFGGFRQLEFVEKHSLRSPTGLARQFQQWGLRYESLDGVKLGREPKREKIELIVFRPGPEKLMLCGSTPYKP